METFLRDLKYGLRVVIKRPGVTLTAAICLALGIGATTVVFSLVNGILLDPLPWREPDRVAFLFTEFRAQGVLGNANSSKELTDYRERSQVFERIEAMVPWYFNLTSGDEPRRLVGGMTSTGLFSMIGAEPQQGRVFTEEEGAQRAKVALVSHRLWQTTFGGDTDLVGSSISLEGQPYTVVGIMRPDFFFELEAADVWVPWSPNPNFPRHVRLLRVAGRLKDGITLERAQGDLDGVARTMVTDYPDAYPADAGFGVEVRPALEHTVGDVRPQLLALFGAVALVLLIACVNVANLLLAQAWQREREVGLRAALGANRWILTRQMVTESLILAVLGGGLGLLLATWGTRAVLSLDLDIPRLHSVSLDWRVALFAVAVSLGTGVLFGLVPAIRASKVNLYISLREGAKATDTGSKQLLRQLLVVAEIALAVVVLIGAGLMIRTLRQFEQVDPGFRDRDLVSMQIFLAPQRYRGAEPQRTFYNALMPRLEQRPEFENVGLINHMPLYALDEAGAVIPQERASEPLESHPTASWRTINPGYFETMAIPLVKGRVFSALDTEESEPVAIIDSELARRLWPDEDPVDKYVKLERDRIPEPGWRRIVGVVDTVRDAGLIGDDNQLLYLPYPQYTYTVVALVLHSSLDASAVASLVRQEIAAVDPFQPIAHIQTVEGLLDRAKSKPRLNRLLFSLFGLAVLILVSVGIYGVMAYAVSQRTREIGLRMALGSPQGVALQLILRQGLKVAVVGLGVGLLAALLLSVPLRSFLSGMLYGVSLFDPLTLLGVLLLVALLSLAASLVPAIRASRIDPLKALRDE